jgi:hypothetical protein
VQYKLTLKPERCPKESMVLNWCPSSSLGKKCILTTALDLVSNLLVEGMCKESFFRDCFVLYLLIKVAFNVTKNI